MRLKNFLIVKWSRLFAILAYTICSFSGFFYIIGTPNKYV